MKITSFLKITFGIALSAACLVGVTGCIQGESDDSTESVAADEGLTGGIAATVNGEEIEEDKVTRYINNFRIRGGYEDDDSWKDYLSMYGYTIESLREDVIGTFIDQELTLQCGEQLGATASEEEIQSYVDEMRGNYSSDEAWQTALEGAGFADEQGYRDALEYSIINKKLEDHFEAEVDITDEDIVIDANAVKSNYDGAKRSSHILFAKEDQETAQEVLDKIKAGELDFAEAAREYSTDTSSAEKGGDVGWDKLTTFVDAYQDALDELEVGQVSDLVESEYGYHIIMVTDSFTAPDSFTSADQLPEEFRTEITTKLTEQDRDDAKGDWLEEMRANNEVVINPMPDNLPYWVDLSDVESPEEQEAIDEATDEQVTEDIETTEAEVGALEADAAGTEAEAGAEAAE